MQDSNGNKAIISIRDASLSPLVQLRQDASVKLLTALVPDMGTPSNVAFPGIIRHRQTASEVQEMKSTKEKGIHKQKQDLHSVHPNTIGKEDA